MRRLFVYCAVGCFVGLAVSDMTDGRLRSGVASALLAVVNLLLLGI